MPSETLKLYQKGGQVHTKDVPEELSRKQKRGQNEE